MIHRTFAVLLLITACCGTGVYAQQAEMTTVIMVRHAEKMNDGTTDPGLSPEGKERAQRLSSLLANTGVDAVYSTNYKRTKETVAPLAESEGLEIQLYHPSDREALRTMIAANRGKTILISGHSNTIPAMANELLRDGPFSNFDESDYGNVIIISLAEGAKPGLVWLRY